MLFSLAKLNLGGRGIFSTLHKPKHLNYLAIGKHSNNEITLGELRKFNSNL